MHCKPNRLEKLRLSLLILCLGLFCYGRLAQAATLNVPGTYGSIQAAINAAGSGDTVLVHDGTYVENINFNRKVITVQSENGAASTTIDGNAGGSVVTFSSGEGAYSVLDGFTITNGSGTGDGSVIRGGGIYCKNSSPTITNCTINSNTAGWGGGGIYCSGSSPTITNCTISNNSASTFHGGGIYCSGSSPTITNCTISNNTANYSGGGIYCSSSLTITNCTINNNIANDGGGIYCSSSLTITNCTINNNIADDGGGIYCWNYSPIITNCTVSSNTANDNGGGILCQGFSSPTITNCTINWNTASDGGGIYCSSSSPMFTNCTISQNTANDNGGGIYNGGISSYWPTVLNSIFWGDRASGIPNEIYTDGTSSIIITYSDIEGGYPGTGNINADPLFVGGGDYHLSENSLCIDAGTNSGAPSNDLDGNIRPYGAGYDMGAYEYGSMLGHNISLTNGWNLISLPKRPSDAAIESILSSISGKYTSVWAFVNNTWQVYDPANPDFSDLLTMEASWGYWIKMTEVASFSVSGTTPSDTIPLVSGWNLVGYNSTDSQDIADALASIDGKYISVWAFIDGAWKVYDPANPDFSDLLIMEPNYGYWINIQEPCNWTLP